MNVPPSLIGSIIFEFLKPEALADMIDDGKLQEAPLSYHRYTLPQSAQEGELWR